ncbi:hypothetical protein [Synechococcus sp. CC9616]|uniref:hypothetical protein n=1 Tax=Synechococcus sp. CC9616 TaxID=110663 RepID=UPI0004B81A21|nr:hypothetical protein [Synechococcus sp. CC9616]
MGDVPPTQLKQADRMKASPDFTFWTPDEAVELLRLQIDFLQVPCFVNDQRYKRRMAKARRGRAYLYLVEAEVERHRVHKVGLTFNSNPLERDPVAYKKVLASVPVSGDQADAFEAAAISWLRLKFQPKEVPIKVWGWGGSSEIINTKSKGVLSEFNAFIERLYEFCAHTKPIWILKDNWLMGDIWNSIMTPYFVSSSSPVFNQHRKRIAEALGLVTEEAVTAFKKKDISRSNRRHAAYRKLHPSLFGQ